MDDLTPARVNQGASGPRAEAMGFGMGGAVETDPLGMIQRIAQYGVILTSKGARSRRLKVAKIAPRRAADQRSRGYGCDGALGVLFRSPIHYDLAAQHNFEDGVVGGGGGAPFDEGYILRGVGYFWM